MENEKKKIEIPKQLPILPLRNTVIFPNQVQPLAIGREKSLSLLHSLTDENKLICMATQKEGSTEDPNLSDLYQIGIAGSIVKNFRMPDGSEHIIVQALERIRIKKIVQNSPFLIGRVELLDDIYHDEITTEALTKNCKNLFNKIIEISSTLTNEHRSLVNNTDDPARLADLIASVLNFSTEEKQEILEIESVKNRLERVHYFLNKEIQILELEHKIQKDVQGELHKSQREYVLKEQLKAIRKELGDLDEEEENEQLKQKLVEANLPDHVKIVADKEFRRLQKMTSMSAEYSVVRNYLEWIADLPWSLKTDDKLDLEFAQNILNRDHYGLENVKKRIIEYLAVKIVKNDIKGPILCFVGPPGVGKTSLGKSIAEALNRKFGRISLGGISDEAEIRGHRKTYIGSMPGRIIRELKKLQVNNPLILLDEIDKLGRDYKGDPASALLEVLDPEQNHSFVDHYLDLEVDLSKIFFIATANQLETIPLPLYDRMEVIDISGYVEEEKLKIAEKHLIPKQIKEHGLDKLKIKFDKKSIREIIHSYTREAGVRNLEKYIATIIRHITTEFALKKESRSQVKEADIHTILGAPKFSNEIKERTSKTGVATGMAWTAYGGDILFFESTLMKGKGNLHLTGKLGDVMKESAQIAFSLLKSRVSDYQIDGQLFESQDLHVHIPAGAVAKDGPSAGITLFVSIFSIFSNLKVRNNVAMTGELTLRGMVLPIGGLKEKILAAKRAEIDTIIIPKKNEKDLRDISDFHLKGLTVYLVDDINEVVSLSIENSPLESKYLNKVKQIVF